MTKKVTVGYDGSKPSSEALLWAAGEASARGAVLRILSCYEIPLAGDGFGGWVPTETYGTLLEDCRNALAQVELVVAEEYPGLKVDAEVSPGPATSALVDDVDADDLIVVGASSHHGAAALLLGSTPRYLVRHSPCPVVVVRNIAPLARPRRIVVGVDGSTASDRALRWAGNEAELHHVDLLVVHSWEYPYLAGQSSTRARDLTSIDARCLVDRVIESAREQFGVPITGELVEGSPSTALLATVRDGDLLVLGSRGRGAIVSGLFGSTVNAVLDRLESSLVVVPTDRT